MQTFPTRDATIYYTYRALYHFKSVSMHRYKVKPYRYTYRISWYIDISWLVLMKSLYIVVSLHGTWCVSKKKTFIFLKKQHRTMFWLRFVSNNIIIAVLWYIWDNISIRLHTVSLQLYFQLIKPLQITHIRTRTINIYRLKW